MTFKMAEKVLFVPLFGLMFLHAAPAAGDYPAPVCNTKTASTIIQIPDMTVRRDTPIGAEIGTATATPLVDAFSCVGIFKTLDTYVKGIGSNAAQINGLNIYKLGPENTGIGYAVYGESTACQGYKPVIGTSESGGSNVQRLCPANTTQPIGEMPEASMKLVFYKIGDITPGPKPTQQVGSFALHINKSSWQLPESQVNSSTFTVNTLGCFMIKPTIKVPLGEVSMKQLSTAGSTAAEQAFSIRLNCDIGTKVKMTLSAGSAGAYDPVNGLLNLEDASSATTAQGVKIQLLSNDIPVTYDTSLEMGTQDNTATFDIALKARYYRVAEPLTAGTANSSATYTITYE